MKWLFKWVFRLILLVVVAAIVLVTALVLSKDAIIRAAAERQIRARTGMDVKIGRLSIGVLSPVVTLQDFKLYNRPEFGGAPFLDIPELHVEYDRAALSRRKLHITLMRFNLAELNVVKNEAGQTNLVNMMNGAAQVRAQKRRDSGEIEFTGVDVLNLSLGKVRFLDLKDRQKSGEVNLGVRDQVFRNVKTEDDLLGVLFILWLRNGGNLSTVPINPPPTSHH